jgi:PKD repeat protein
MTRRVPSLALLVALALSALLPAAVSAADLPVPSSMAAVGDSISQAASSAGSLGADAPQNSWSTGTSTTVNSHFLRLRTLNSQLVAYNRSVSGAKVADLNAQMQSVAAIEPDPGYLTVLIGGNDVCTDTVAQMTSVADFRARFATAMQTITSQSPGTSIYVVSIPNVYQLWDLFDSNFWARFIWATAGICQSMLANPTSTQQADVDRRAAVRQRNMDFNAQLAQVCALHAQCRFDNNAAFNTSFTTGDVSGDYFHPSVAGQAKLASVSWTAGYTWTTTPPPQNAAPSASFTSSCIGLTCSFTDTSTDADGAIVGRQWSFGDGTGSPLANPNRTYTGAGTYPVSLTVTDDDGATASASGSVTVTAPPPPEPTPMWVGGLSSTTASSRNGWTASVTIAVTDGASPVSNVAVTGTWSAGSGATGCTTSAQGTCTVTASLNKKTASTTFRVIALSRSGWEYQPPSNPVTITVAKP